MPRGIQDSSKRDFIKKGKIHQAQKCASTLRQERSLESASKRPKSIKLRKKGGKNVPKSSFNQEMKCDNIYESHCWVQTRRVL